MQFRMKCLKNVSSLPTMNELKQKWQQNLRKDLIQSLNVNLILILNMHLNLYLNLEWCQAHMMDLKYHHYLCLTRRLVLGRD